jgi:hypothetical protein
MKRIITVIALGASLAVAGGAAAQENGEAIINADGNSGASRAGLDPAVDADGPTIVYGDLYPGPGTTVIGPADGSSATGAAPGATGNNITATDGDAAALGPGSATAAPGTVTGGVSGTTLLGPDGTYSVSDTPPSNVSVGDAGAAPIPAPVAAPVEEVAAAPVDSSVATGSDLDGDNYADALELEVGLDPNNPDGDGDGVADGDEVNIYGTDPYTWDTDGDGVSDGNELFDTRTDPLVWTDMTGTEAAATGTETLAVEGSASGVAGDSDGDRLADADEAAVGTDPNTPDSDGDGYYDGDEWNLGTDPHDPGSFPAT